MARSLKMLAVAEGAEDRNDWDLLRQLGCDLVQGYFCAKPMAGNKLIDWLDEWEVRRRELIRPD
jgi:EAL domain-containing protein (putative c-di-GMP-specific phosphodiesterase class I)